ncbi:MAG: type toxin-antitoxin system VapC family toxin [Verrucomicrobiaceae bacterium]|nr:type toxin-antitoxin system VapC family toxin [Verrucomicrobiaceae bacterium]
MRYLLDSNVLSEPTNKHPEPKVVQWLATYADQCLVSILALGEVERGIAKLPNGGRRQKLTNWFQDLAEGMEKDGRVIIIDRALMSFWTGVYNREERLTKRKPPFVDTMMAATAEMHGLTMVTRNEKDFPKSLAVFNPWKP